MTRLHQRGLTLIELMVALALFATVGLLTWHASTRLIDGRAHIGAELERWREISRALHRLELELLQIAPPQLGAGPGGEAVLRLEHADDGSSLLRVLLVDSGGDGPLRCGFRFAGGQFSWLQWPGLRGDASTAPEAIPLLEAVAAVRWRFLSEGEWRERWPPPAGNPALTGLPDAIAFEMDLADAGTFNRVFALR